MALDQVAACTIVLVPFRLSFNYFNYNGTRSNCNSQISKVIWVVMEIEMQKLLIPKVEG